MPPDPRESTRRFRILGLATHLATTMIALPITTRGFSLKSYVASGRTSSSGYVGGALVGALWFAGNNANIFLFSTWTSLLELSWYGAMSRLAMVLGVLISEGA